MKIGGTDGSHHSTTLRSLAKRGLVEMSKRHSLCCGYGLPVDRVVDAFSGGATDRHPPTQGCSCRGSCVYRRTQAGRDALASAENSGDGEVRHG